MMMMLLMRLLLLLMLVVVRVVPAVTLEVTLLKEAGVVVMQGLR